MNKKNTLLLTCMLFAFNTVFSQDETVFTGAASTTHTVTPNDVLAGQYIRFFAGQTFYQNGGEPSGFTVGVDGSNIPTLSYNAPAGANWDAVGFRVFDGNTNLQVGNDRSLVIITGDVSAPVISLNTPGTQTIEAGPATYTELGATASDVIDAGYTDNLTSDIIIDASAVMQNVVGSYSVTYNVTDKSGNPAAQVTRTVDVIAATNPVISNIAMSSNNATSTLAKAGDVITLTFDSSETIVTPTVTIAGQAASVSNIGNAWTAIITLAGGGTQGAAAYSISGIEDSFSNTATDETGSGAVSVDTIAPVAIAQNPSIASDANGDATVTAAQVDNGSNDANGVSLSISHENFTCSGLLVQFNQNLTVTDPAGNTSTASYTVTVTDNIKPVLTLTAQPIVEHQVGTFLFLGIGGASVSDNCGGGFAAISPTHSIDTNTLGDYTLTYGANGSVSDGAGNKADPITSIFRVVDNIDPIAIAVAGPIDVNLNGTTTITAQDVDNGSSDNYVAGGITLSLDKSSFSCDDIVAGQVSTPVTVTLTVTDSSNNTATATVVVNVIDDVIPTNVALVNPTYVHPTGTPYVEQGFTQDEACVNGYTIVSSDLDVNQWGTYTIVYKVLDKSGNESAEITRTQVVNNVPTTDAANYTVNQDTENHVFDVLAGDSFGPDGPESFTISGAMSAQNGTLILNDKGTTTPTDDSVTYSPFATYNGPDSFSYTLEDENGDTATRTVNITVRPIVPVPLDDSETVDKNSIKNIIAVLGNDDFGGNEAHAQWPLTFTNGSKISASVEGGAISIGNNGTSGDLTDDVILYSPPANFVGVDTFMYTITDSDGDATSATVTITVVEGSNGNSTPTALDDVATVHAGSTMNIIDVLDNDSPGTDDYIDNGLTLTNGTSLGASTNGGVINVDNKGTASTSDDEFLYSAPVGFTGTDTFSYTITDASGDASTATVTITVNAVTNVPVAMDDTLSVLENSGATSINVTANDSFGTDGAAPIPFIINSPDHITGTTANGGTFALDTKGNADPLDDEVSYTPAANFVGTDTFQYTIRDTDFDESIGTVVVTVGPVVTVNGTPTAQDDAVTVAQNSLDNVINVLDDNGAGADSYGTDGANATHPLTFPNGSTTSGSANGGAITVVGNTIEYTPASGFAGTDSFDYVITDLSGDASTATVTITVTGSVQVSVPTAQNDAVSVAYNSTSNVINVLADNGNGVDDFGSDGAIDNGLTMTNGTLISASTNGGAISIDNKGTNSTLDDEFVYDAPSNWSGVDTFMYTITDASGDASSATVTVTVAALVMDAPTAVDDTFAVLEDSSNNDLAILSNGDSFGDDGAGSITLSGATGTAGGSIVINQNGTPLILTDDTVTYTPLASFVGTDTFTYTLEDGNGDTAIAIVTITVGTVVPPATTPTAQDDTVTVPRFSMNNLIDVMGNDDFGADGKNATHPLTLSNGRLTGTSTGGRFIQVHDSGTPLDFSDDTVSYSPGSLLTDSFEYTITDGNGDATTGTVNITMTAIVIKSGESINISGKEVFENSFMTYPNPSRGNVKTILLSGLSTEARVILSDVTGKVIYNSLVKIEEGTNQLEFNFTVKPGILLMKIVSSELDFGTTKMIFK